MVEVCQTADSETHNSRGGAQHDGSGSPGVIRVVAFSRGQGHPAHIGSGPDPRHASRIPVGSETHCRRRSPIPAIVDIHPVAVMMSGVSEGLGGNPGVVPIIVSPPAFGEGGPPGADSSGSPKLAPLSLVVHTFPSAVLFEIVCLILQFRRKIPNGVTLHAHPLGPQGVTALIPIIPIRIHIGFSCPHLAGIGDDRGRPWNHLVLRLVTSVNKGYRTL